MQMKKLLGPTALCKTISKLIKILNNRKLILWTSASHSSSQASIELQHHKFVQKLLCLSSICDNKLAKITYSEPKTSQSVSKFDWLKTKLKVKHESKA